MILIFSAFQAPLCVGVERRFTSPLSIYLGYLCSPGSELLSSFLTPPWYLLMSFLWLLFLLGHWTPLPVAVMVFSNIFLVVSDDFSRNCAF